MPKFQDLTGERFGRLEVLSQASSSICGRTRWNCKCECGNTTVVASCHLKSGHTSSCGCWHIETLINNVKEAQQKRNNYMQSRTRLYRIYRGMITRTENKNSVSYEYYGGRGISVCEEWRHDFSTFKAWALASGYKQNLSIDRINPNGDYEPSNCRWADTETQANNKRVNRNVMFGGKILTVSQWATEIGISKDTIKKRLDAGMPPDIALTKPLNVRRSAYEAVRTGCLDQC